MISVAENGKPHTFEGSLTPVDATEQFRPGGIPREFSDFSAGGGYTFWDERVPNGYDWGKNVWTMGPSPLPSGELTEITLPSGTHGEIRCGIQTNSGNLYLSSGRYCLKLSTATAAATVVADFSTIAGMSTSVTITSVCTYLSNAYWGGYAGSPATAQPMVQHLLASDGFTSGATCARWQLASFYGVDGAGSWDQWLIGTVATNAAFKYTNSASPLVDTNWTPASADGTKVGDPAFPVNKIIASRQAPFFLTPVGVFSIQRLGVYRPNISPHWRDMYHPYNGVAGVIVAGRLYANILSGIDMLTGLEGQLNDMPYLVHPGADLPTENPAAGDTWAMCRDGDWVVAAVYNSNTTSTYVCWGKPRSSVPGQPGLTNYVWHIAPLVIEGERVTWMEKMAANGVPFIMVATSNSANTTSHLYRMSMPRNGNVLQEFAQSGPWRCRTDTCTLYLSRYPGIQGSYSEKAIRQSATVSKNASDTSYLQVYINPDETGRVQLGANVTESPYVEARILSDVSGRQMAPSIDFKAGSSTTPPILRAQTYWTAEGIKAATTYQGRFRFGKGIQLRNGTLDTTSDPQATWELVKSAQGPRPATITDWKGTVYTIAFEQGAAWIERENKTGEQYEIDAVLRFTVLSRTASYNDGIVYDGEAEYAA